MIKENIHIMDIQPQISIKLIHVLETINYTWNYQKELGPEELELLKM